MSRTVPRASGTNWLAAVAGAMFLAVVLALLTTPRTDSKYPSPALPPAAHATVTTPTPAAPTAAAKAPTASSVSRPSFNMEAGQRLSIDPATGQSRPIEHDDAQPPSAARFADAPVEPVFHDSGAVGVAVPETSDVYTVATKAADGTISIAHAQGLAQAKATMRAGAKPKREVRNDR